MKVPPKTKKRGKKRPAKRPPPKGRVLATAKAKTMIEMPGPDPVEIWPGFGRSKKSRMHYLRAQAGWMYTTNEKLPTVQDICELPMFREVEVKQMQHWCGADRWNERRKEFWDGINQGVRKKLGNELIQRKIEMLEDCGKIYDQNIDMIMGNSGLERPQPKNYESLLRAHTNLLKTMVIMGHDVIDVVVPAVTPETVTLEDIPKIAPELTAEEARIAALAVVEQRRRLRSRNQELEDDDDGETVD
jgi:hypothetical protein